MLLTRLVVMVTLTFNITPRVFVTSDGLNRVIWQLGMQYLQCDRHQDLMMISDGSL